MKVKLRLEYFGKPFVGWQEQPGRLTVQGEIQRALAVYFKAQAAKIGINIPERIPVTGSGRTDSGVHARGQVANFTWPEGIPCDCFRLKAALNGLLHHDICVLDCEPAASDFDARFDAQSKCYSYLMLLSHPRKGLLVDRSWCVGRKLDVAKMVSAARLFVGEHDFTSFRAGDCSAGNPVRNILKSEITRVSDFELKYIVVGTGFLKQMVRIIVGTLVGVGRGEFSVEDVAQMFAARNRNVSGRTAPPSGLVLEWVSYQAPAEK